MLSRALWCIHGPHLSDGAAPATRARDVEPHAPDVSRPAAPPTPFALRATGLLGWDLAGWPCAAALIRAMARSTIATTLAAFFLTLSFQSELGGLFVRNCGADAAECWKNGSFLSEVSLPMGALLILVLFGLKRNRQRLEDTFCLMQGVSGGRQYGDWEARRQRWDAAVFAIAWLCSMLTAGFKRDPRDAEAPLLFHVWVTAVFSAVILALAYGVARICRSFIIMVDTFCCDVVGAMHLQQVAHVWNMTAAVLRKASADVESSLAVLCVILAISVPLLAADTATWGMQLEDATKLLPELCVTCGILYALVLAAMVSERAARVPALINAISLGHNTDRERQQTVDYITSSAAGFYLFDMRLTTGRVFKLMYIWCLVVIGVLTRVAAPL